MLTINLISEDGEKKQVIINNPTTGDNILHYLILLIIAVTGLIFTFKKVKFKNIKLGNMLLLLTVVSIPFAVFASEKYQVNITFNEIEIIGEFENYNVVINKENGEIPETREIRYGKEVGELPEVTKEGYTFDKWVDDNGNEVTKDTIITSDKEISAVFNINTYTISYKLNDGQLEEGKSNPDEYTIETETFTLNNPSKEGYTFIGWTCSDGITPEENITINKGTTGNLNYEANYKKNKYIISFDSNGGSSVDDIEINPEDKIGTLPAPTKEGYTFDKWIDEEGNEVTEDTIPTENTTYYAKWEISFANASWEEIKATYEKDPTSLPVGDTKCISVDGYTTTNDNGCSNGRFKVRIANTTPCSEVEVTSTSSCGLVIEFVDIIGTHNMNSSDTNVGGWPATDMRSYLTNTNVVSGRDNISGETNFISTDKLYLLSTKEVGFEVSYDSAKNETRILDYYNLNNNNASKIKQYNKNNYNWWLRSGNSSRQTVFYTINPEGCGNAYASRTYGFAPVFRIAE